MFCCFKWVANLVSVENIAIENKFSHVMCDSCCFPHGRGTDK